MKRTINTFKEITFGLLFLFVTVTTENSYSQDIHFTQFKKQPLLLNPAMGGDYVGDIRMSVIQRRQWAQLGAPLMTNAFSIEKKVRIYPDFITVGLQFLNDKVSTLNYESNTAYLSITYMREIKKSLLHYGAQFGFTEKQASFDQTFPSQYNSANGQYDPNLSNGETSLNAINYMDVNAGIYLITRISNQLMHKFGISYYHLNKPNNSLIEGENRVATRFAMHYHSEFTTGHNIILSPSIQILRSNDATAFLTTLNLKRIVTPDFALTSGLGLRGNFVENDALIFIMGMEIKTMELSASFDWNTSSLSSQSSQKSSIELSLIFRTPPKVYETRHDKKRYPCIYPGWNN